MSDTFLNAVKRIAGRFILFHEEIFQSCCFLYSKNSFEVDHPITNFCKIFLGCAVHVFHMPQWKVARVCLYQGNRILSCFC